MPTILDVWGAQTRFPSIADAAAINSTHRHATNEAYKEATAFYADDWDADFVARSVFTVVFGGSVSSGCGALSPSPICDIGGSWVRLMADKLTARLRQGKRARVHLWNRNAVGAEYFSMCLHKRVHNAHIVLLEFEANTLTSSAASILDLAQRVRRANARARIVLVCWPSETQLLKAPHPVATARIRRRGNNHPDDFIEDQIDAMADEHRIDACFLSTVLRAMPPTAMRQHYEVAKQPGKHQGKHKQPESAYHPSAEGHDILAEAVARMLIRRFEGGVHRSNAVAVPLRQKSWYNQSQPETPIREWCMLNALELPLAQAANGTEQGSWALVDDGKSKGVHKWGYASTGYTREPLKIGPLLPERSCGLFIVNLAYLQSWRAEMGTFVVNCRGCLCTRQPGLWSAVAQQFPVVETSLTRIADDMPRLNVSTTVFTAFYVLKRTTQCVIQVSHHRKEPRAFAGHLRIDGLDILEADCPSRCYLQQFGASGTARVWVRNMTSACGHEVRACACSDRGTVVEASQS